MKQIRYGFTTGACAAAATAAVVRALLTRQSVTDITLQLPKLEHTFPLSRCEMKKASVRCGVIKDAGDDPDVTHGLEILAEVEQSPAAGVLILGGEGVGVVTLPGLPVAVGEAAINPMPRKMITQSLQEEVRRILTDEELNPAGWKVTISAPGGERVAKKTMNPRLGILGGISILGTTGIVIPYSLPAYRISIHLMLKVAAQQNVRWAVLATGKQSEAFARRRAALDCDLGILVVGDDISYALDQAVRLGFEGVTIAGMIGKITKLAQGQMQTHISKGGVDFSALENICVGLGLEGDILSKIRSARTAAHVQKLISSLGFISLENGFNREVAQRAARQVFCHVHGHLAVWVWLFSAEGDLLASAQEQKGCA